MWIEPIFDRTQADADYARANRNDPIHYKGAFNYTDLNRIVGNMYHIAGLAYLSITARNGWTVLDIPKQSDIKQILSDLQYLKDQIYGNTTGLAWNQVEAQFVDWDDFESRISSWDELESWSTISVEDVPEMPIYQYEKINQIEKLIFQLEARAQNVLLGYEQLNTVELGGDWA